MLSELVAKKYIASSPQKHRNYEHTSSVEYIRSDITYETFFTNFLIPNVPCLFKSNFTEHWESRSEWVSSSGSVNFNFLERNFGDALAPVVDCSIKYYNAQLNQGMLVKDYTNYWRKLTDEADTDLPSDGEALDSPCLYLKDWHFTRDYPQYQAYETPVFFTSDWLNDYWKQREDVNDDYCFVYMGPKGTWTPFHADVLGSYSWSANVCGRKRWLLFPPGAESSLKDQNGHLVYDVSLCVEKEHQSSNRKKFHEAVSKGIDIIQEPGEIIFVPSGWYHQVWNLEDTISINHNWLNGCNIDLIWRNLQEALKEVEKEIYDCKSMDDWNDTCQVILRANHGMDYNEFFKLLECVASRVFQQLQPCSEGDHTNFKDYWHSVFDLHQVKQILECMKHEYEQILPELNDQIVILLERILDVVSKTKI